MGTEQLHLQHVFVNLDRLHTLPSFMLTAVPAFCATSVAGSSVFHAAFEISLPQLCRQPTPEFRNPRLIAPYPSNCAHFFEDPKEALSGEGNRQERLSNGTLERADSSRQCWTAS